MMGIPQENIASWEFLRKLSLTARGQSQKSSEGLQGEVPAKGGMAGWGGGASPSSNRFDNWSSRLICLFPHTNWLLFYFYYDTQM